LFKPADSDGAITLSGFLYFTRGIGNVLAGTVSAALVSNTSGSTTGSAKHFSGAYGAAGGEYAKVILFAATMMGLAGLGEIVGAVLRQRQKRD
jgi:hypothetical protein